MVNSKSELEEFGLRLEKYIRDNGYTNRAFAKSVGVREATISQYIYGTRYPQVRLIIRICKKHNISADWLLGIKN